MTTQASFLDDADQRPRDREEQPAKPLAERAIVCSQDEVRALLTGEPTEIRRVVKVPRRVSLAHCAVRQASDQEQFLLCNLIGDIGIEHVHCSFGRPGERRWVRETWSEVHPAQVGERYSQPGQAGIPGPPRVKYRVIYRADGETVPTLYYLKEYPYRTIKLREAWHTFDTEGFGWMPSTQMPRWASRLTLEVISVRVEEAGLGVLGWVISCQGILKPQTADNVT